jgi:hypothetical protein
MSSPRPYIEPGAFARSMDRTIAVVRRAFQALPGPADHPVSRLEMAR